MQPETSTACDVESSEVACSASTSGSKGVPDPESSGSIEQKSAGTDDTRRSSRRQTAAVREGGFKRTGWAARDEDKVESEPKRLRRSAGCRAQPAKCASTPPAEAELSPLPHASDDADAATRKRPRELFPVKSELPPAAKDEPPTATAPPVGAEPPPPTTDATPVETPSLAAAAAHAASVTPPRASPAFAAASHAAADDDDDDGAHAQASGAAVAPGAGDPPSHKESELVAPKKKRNRSKKLDEGDWRELKPRHLRGKKKEEMAARRAQNEAAAAARRARPDPPAETQVEQTAAKLMRLLRPKLRRWCMYEWFYSPVDWSWFRDNEFARMLHDCGLGQVTRLMRCEWSFLRMMLGRARRFSASFVLSERAKLRRYRDEVRALRRRQAAGMHTATDEARLGLHGSAQMAVGQRVTAFHPKERHLSTGTVLTPDGDHYKVQFDRTKLGVQLVKDVFVMPLLDGSRGIDFTSPRSMGRSEGATDGALIADAARRGVIGPNGVRADARELQLVAYITRLLERKKLLMKELKKVCGEAESTLKRRGAEVHAELLKRGQQPPHGLVVADVAPPRVEVTAAQQRQLGQVPPPPVLPSLAVLMQQSRLALPSSSQQLGSCVSRWQQEIRWLQGELRGTTTTLDNALVAMRPLAQRLSMALGAAAPEPKSCGFSLAQCAQLRNEAAERAAAVLAYALREAGEQRGAAAEQRGAAAEQRGAAAEQRGASVRAPSPRARQLVSASMSFLLQVQAWAAAPPSPVECKFALVSALQKLKPAHEQNFERFKEIMATTHVLQGILCGAGLPPVSATPGTLGR